MTSRFVSAGAIDTVTGEAAPPTDQPSADPRRRSDAKSDEWAAAQASLEADRRRREEARAKVAAGDEKSLYEVLQANKAAKQAAFEEAAKLKNQFRALDDDEIEFLDDVKARAREEETRLRRETEMGLERFRAAQRGKGAAGDEAGAVGEDGEAEIGWAAAGRKRKREKDREPVKGLVRRRTSAAGDESAAGRGEGEAPVAPAGGTDGEDGAEARSAAGTKAKAGGLVDYGSDDDEDDEGDDDGS